MDEKQCDERLIAVEQRSKSNTHRIDKLEQNNEAMLELVSSVKVLATKVDYVCKGQDELNGRLTAIEDKPAARLDQIVTAIVVAAVGICVGYLFGGVM